MKGDAGQEYMVIQQDVHGQSGYQLNQAEASRNGQGDTDGNHDGDGDDDDDGHEEITDEGDDVGHLW